MPVLTTNLHDVLLFYFHNHVFNHYYTFQYQQSMLEIWQKLGAVLRKSVLTKDRENSFFFDVVVMTSLGIITFFSKIVNVAFYFNRLRLEKFSR